MIHVITRRDIADHRLELIAWAKANGIDPKRIDEHGLTVEQVADRTVIAYSEIQHGANGLPLIDPDGPDHHLTVHRTRILSHPLPQGIGHPLCTCTLGELDPLCDHPADTEGDQDQGGDPQG